MPAWLKSDQYSLIEQSVHITINYTVLNSPIHSNRTFRMH